MQPFILVPVFTTLLASAPAWGPAGASLASVTIFSVGLPTILATATLLAASLAIGYLTKPTGPDPSDGHVAVKQTIPPRIWAYGRNRIAGTYMLFEQKDTYSYDVQALLSGRAAAYVGFYLHDDTITFVGGGLPVNGTKYVEAGEDGRYGDNNIRIDARLGEDTETPYAELLTDLPEIWTEDHRGDGIASVMMICNETDPEDFLENYPNGLPQLSAVMDCFPVWDPRDLAQDPDDSSTWLVSSNLVLNIIDYLTNSDRGGMGLSRELLIIPVLDALMAEADKCDEEVDTKEGVEPRYTCNIWGTFDLAPEYVLADMLASSDAWISTNGDGTLALKVGVYDPDAGPEGPITEKHILGFSVDFAVADEELVNELTLGFTSPDHDYTTVPGDPWRDEASITLHGKTRSQPFSPKAVQSHSQLRRLAKRNMARLNAPIRGQMTTTLFGLTKSGKRWINLQYPFFAELADCVVEVRRTQTDFVAGTCTFDWVIVDPETIDEWDPETEEGEAPLRPDRLVDLTHAIFTEGHGAMLHEGEAVGLQGDADFTIDLETAP